MVYQKVVKKWVSFSIVKEQKFKKQQQGKAVVLDF